MKLCHRNSRKIDLNENLEVINDLTFHITVSDQKKWANIRDIRGW
jgi:hypothetical protein